MSSNTAPFGVNNAPSAASGEPATGVNTIAIGMPAAGNTRGTMPANNNPATSGTSTERGNPPTYRGPHHESRRTKRRRVEQAFRQVRGESNLVEYHKDVVTRKDKPVNETDKQTLAFVDPVTVISQFRSRE